MNMYRIMRTDTTEKKRYITTGSYGHLSFSSRGRIYHRLADIKVSMIGRKHSIYQAMFPDKYPPWDYRHPDLSKKYELETRQLPYPESLVIIDMHDTVVGTLQEVCT